MRTYRALLAAILLVLLPGCASSEPPVPNQSPRALSFDDGSQVDFAANMLPCMSDYGWKMEAGSDGGIRTDAIPSGQEDVYRDNLEACMAEFEYDVPPPTLTDAQLREIYPHALWEWRCLQDAGFSPETPPSEQTFVDTYHAEGWTWSAYSALTGTLGEEEIIAMFEECPRSR